DARSPQRKSLRPPPLPEQASRGNAGARRGVGLKIALGIGIGLVAVVVFGGGALGISRLLGWGAGDVAVATNSNQPAPEVPALKSEEPSANSKNASPASKDEESKLAPTQPPSAKGDAQKTPPAKNESKQ